ncbi:MAG: hypothetical protein N2Z79_05305, partial [Candidatus Omnitrophica bacterium]|nr:hypothetical protein [Candidatus Omnitrophota bacterium]
MKTQRILKFLEISVSLIFSLAISFILRINFSVILVLFILVYYLKRLDLKNYKLLDLLFLFVLSFV